jgi:cytochrome c-type biogenesis protein CcmF
VAIWRKLNEDLYINFAGYEDGTAVFQAYVFPLVSWIWIGFWVLTVGTLICLVPNKVRTADAAQPRAKATRREAKEVELAR